MILAIETATRICSVALFDNNKVVGLLESADENTHSSILHVLIDRLLKESGIGINDLRAVAVSKGPGSYTGLRIGVSAAKGFCYAKDIPLIAINTLESMAAGMKDRLLGDKNTIIGHAPEGLTKHGGLIESDKQKESHGLTTNDQASGEILLVPMIDARRMEVYSAIYNMNLENIRETEAEIITAESFADLRKTNKLVVAGDGADKCKGILAETSNGPIQFLEGFNASAAYMLPSAIKAFANQQFENVAYFEPFYLKDFIAGKPRVKGL